MSNRRSESNEESICCFEENTSIGAAEESIHENRKLEAREERFDTFLDDSLLYGATPSKQPKVTVCVVIEKKTVSFCCLKHILELVFENQ